MLLFRLSGVFLLRLADRQLAGLLFQLPPRRTRVDSGPVPHEPPLPAKPSEQPFTVGLPRVADPARQARLDVVPVDPPGGILPPHPSHPPAELSDVALPQEAMVGPDAIADECQALPTRPDLDLAGMEPQTQPRYKVPQRCGRFPQRVAVVVKDDEVVAVAHVPAQPEPTGDEVVQRRQIPVSEPLAGQVADGQPAPTPVRGEQVIARKVLGNRLLVVGVVHDQVHQRQHPTVLDEPAEEALENLVVDAREVLADVELDEVRMPAQEFLGPVGRRVRPLALPAGVGLQRIASGTDKYGKPKPARLGLPRAVNRTLKRAVLGAALSAINQKDNAFKDYYEGMVRNGMIGSNARHAVARKLLTVMWGMWKTHSPFDANLISGCSPEGSREIYGSQPPRKIVRVPKGPSLSPRKRGLPPRCPNLALCPNDFSLDLASEPDRDPGWLQPLGR